MTHLGLEIESSVVTISPALRPDELEVLRDTDIDFNLLPESTDVQSVVDFGEPTGSFWPGRKYFLYDFIMTFADTIQDIRGCPIEPGGAVHSGYEDC